MKRLLSFLSLLLVAVSSFAQQFTVGDLNYSVLSSTDKTAQVYSGTNATGEVLVPETVTYNDVEYRVTTVGGSAFYQNKNITSVEMPSVTSIGSYAFRDCSALTSVDLPAATYIDDRAFNNCSALTSVALPAATSIGSNAFRDCSKICSLRIGSVEQWCNVNFGGSYANPLEWTSQTVELYIGDSETPATSIEVPNTVTSIPDYAFPRTTITSVSAPAATSIGSSAFSGCSALTSVDLPAATSIGSSAFSSCSVLTSVDLPAATSIDSNAFSGCSALTSVDLPAATSIGNQAFINCSALTSVDLPAATSIGSSAFFRCYALTSVDLPAATSIGSNAFWECYALTSVDLPAATSIGSNAFINCSKISSLRIGSVEQWCNVNFEGSYANPLEYTSQTVELYIGDSETPATSIEVPNTVTSIPNYAFRRTTITSVLAPAVTSIGSSAFTSCPLLSEISFASSTPSTASSCFDSHTSLTVPDNAYNAYVAAWPSYANQITMAGQREREVTVNAKETESAIHKAVGEENLRHVLSLKVKGSINGYDIMILRNKMINLHHLDLSEATIEGNDYEYYTGYHTSDNEIGAYAFYNLPNLFSVKLPEVTAIRSYAFAECSHLREINLPESLTTLSSYAFYNCIYEA